MENKFDQRTDYILNKALRKEDLSQDPFEVFHQWYDLALKRVEKDPNAMILATYDGKVPRGRVVLLKELDEKGFVYFTNYESDKVRETNDHPVASLTFYWKELERQVRVEGVVELASSEESDAYFKSRPLGSRLGAWSSPQSREIESRDWLEQEVEKNKMRFDESVARPPFWGGLRLIPNRFEFWQGQSSRLHDRITFKKKEGEWEKVRLAP